ncbi:chorismate mutase [Candidatus Coxiella mudrowiae]|uniref:chorismate mutase n=1 Tax=Candidatus Coxiella mudrowiae TaxID=2054173 RepID=UPI0009E48941
MDEIDYQIHDLLNQRAQYALEIVKVKIAEDGKLTKFYRPKRKAEILEKKSLLRINDLYWRKKSPLFLNPS